MRTTQSRILLPLLLALGSMLSQALVTITESAIKAYEELLFSSENS